MGLWKSIKLFFKGWKRIENPPKWVLKKYDGWKRKLETHPYNKTKHFFGKNYTYKVRHGKGAQGEAPILGWYKRKRNKTHHEKGKSYYQIGLENVPSDVLRSWKRSAKSKREFKEWVESSGYKFVHGG